MNGKDCGVHYHDRSWYGMVWYPMLAATENLKFTGYTPSLHWSTLCAHANFFLCDQMKRCYFRDAVTPLYR